ncbi:hypothetical protein [Vibrio coralliilyticus]|uniref:hypothetical protein n=1 Tax=Vibrio coralliilyticus TaxID=190893 RepID=UPI0018097DFE|nr:hypothetical protein [Vibrio coralliilyticus]NUW66946.1 hypothetical protein [Vibrio coralliilyticus]
MKFREHIDTVIVCLTIIGSAIAVCSWVTLQQNRMESRFDQRSHQMDEHWQKLDDRFYQLLSEVKEDQANTRLDLQRLTLTKADKTKP